MNGALWTGKFWKALAERVIATLVFTLIGIATADGFDVMNADWPQILVAVGVAGGLSLLKGIVANLATGTGPGLGTAETVTTPQAMSRAIDQENQPDP